MKCNYILTEAYTSQTLWYEKFDAFSGYIKLLTRQFLFDLFVSLIMTS